MIDRKFLSLNVAKSDIESIKDLILTAEQYRDHPFAKSEGQRSYVIEVKKGSKHLLYFGSEHTNEIGDPLFDEIKQAFVGVNPQIVLVEGMEHINDKKERLKEESKKVSLEESVEQGENMYALKLAIDAGVDFESPEPRFDLEIQMLLDNGYSKKDIFTFYIYRTVHQYKRDHKQKSTREGLREYIAPYIRDFRISSRWPKEEIDDFENELFLNLDINSEKYEMETDPIPREGQKQLATNEVSRASNKFRDRYMVGRIAEALKKYDRVLIVYGTAHAVQQEPAVRALLT